MHQSPSSGTLDLFGIAHFLICSGGFWPFIAIALQNLHVSDNYVQNRRVMSSGTEKQRPSVTTQTRSHSPPKQAKYTGSLWNIILTCYKSGLQELMGILPFPSPGTGSHCRCRYFTPLQILFILQVLLSSLRWLKCDNDTRSVFTLTVPVSWFVFLLLPLVCGLYDIGQYMVEIVNSYTLVRRIIPE